MIKVSFKSGGVIMSPELQQLVQNIDQLPPIDRWEILEHLMRQFKQSLEMNVSESITTSSQTNLFKHSYQDILLTTQGSWGNQSPDEIDNQLAQQRQLDWGE